MSATARLARRSPSPETRRPHRPRRRRRPRLRRTAARRGTGARGIPHDRHRPRPAQGRRDQPRRVLHPGRAHVGRRRVPSRRPAVGDHRPGGRRELDTINICVPTPLRKTKDPDLSYVVSAVEMIAAHLHPGMLVVLESTTYPGHYGGSRPADSRDGAASRRARLLSRVFARARRPGQREVEHEERAEGRRRPDADVHGAGEGALLGVDRHRRSKSARRKSPRW